jgi:hypothetical protein
MCVYVCALSVEGGEKRIPTLARFAAMYLSGVTKKFFRPNTGVTEEEL